MGRNAAGLLTGLGRGLREVSGRMFERERAAADEYRKKRLMDYGHDLSEKSAETQRTFVAGETDDAQTYASEEAQIARDSASVQAGVSRAHSTVENQKARDDSAGLVGKVIDTFDEDGKPIQITINAKGEQVRVDKRGPTAAEASMANAKLKGTKKEIKAAIWTATKDELFSDEFATFASDAKNRGGASFDDFWASFLDPEGSFKQDAALAHMKATDPERHAAYTGKRVLFAKGLENGLNPSDSLKYAHSEYKAGQSKATAATKQKVTEATYKAAGVTKTVADAWADLPQTDGTVSLWSEEMMNVGQDQVGAAKFAKKLSILKTKNPWLFEQLKAERERLKATPSTLQSNREGLLKATNKSSTPVAEPNTMQKETGLLRSNLGR